MRKKHTQIENESIWSKNGIKMEFLWEKKHTQIENKSIWSKNDIKWRSYDKKKKKKTYPDRK